MHIILIPQDVNPLRSLVSGVSSFIPLYSVQNVRQFVIVDEEINDVSQEENL